MTRLVFPDDPKDLHEPRVRLDDRMTKQSFDLPVSAFFGQRDHSAQLLEQPVLRDNALGIEPLDCRTEHDLDEAVDVAAGAINEQGHLSALLVPTTKHQIMLALISAVPLDRGNEFIVVR